MQEKTTLKEAIEFMTNLVNDKENPFRATLYTTGDVLRILQSIHVAPVLPEHWEAELHDTVVEAIEQNFTELVDYDDCEFRIGCGNTIELESVEYTSRGIRQTADEIVEGLKYRLFAGLENEVETEKTENDENTEC